MKIPQFYQQLVAGRKPVCWLLVGIFCVFGTLGGSVWGYQDNYWPAWVINENECAKEHSRLNFAGPLIEQTWSNRGTTGGMRPFWAYFRDDCAQEVREYGLYPFISTKCGPNYKCSNFFNLSQSYTSYCGDCGLVKEQKTTMFPIYFCRETGDPCTSYFGIFPVGGSVQNFLGVDQINWMWFPLYLGLERGCNTKHSVIWPIFKWQTGPCSGGSAIWPIAGHFWERGVYDEHFYLWPLIYQRIDYKEDGCIARRRAGLLPLFAIDISETRKSTTYLWPFFNTIESCDPCYYEQQFPWPLFVQARGEDRYINRWAPFYSHSIVGGVEKKWYLWPLVKYKCWEECGVAIDQQQLLYFLVWRQRQRSLCNPCCPPAIKEHVWPLYSYWDNGAGRKQFQMLSPFEVFFPANEAVREMYTPLFSFFRYSQDAPGHERYSLLFDFVGTETTPESKEFHLGPLFDFYSSCECSHMQIFKGLFGITKKNGKKSLKLFWITI